MMNQLKFYKNATWILLFLNIVVLAFFLSKKPRPPHLASPNSFQSEVIEILELDGEQATAFRGMAQTHSQEMRFLNERQQQLLPPYFEQLANHTKDVNKEAILAQFQQLGKEKIEVTYQHFRDVKSILNEDQLSHFDQLIGRFVDNILLEKKEKTPPPKDFE